ncbi:hypothetical protein M427DRAFT_106906 [Gonapodya prolifera JEL478]|uniref:Glutamine amidotransferase type-2 domain-containing protein n=1 Tax=Gonapodya prolifera (strain JEL478) TaxID=1344416 RepID=A0A139B0L7_GONPJ|nr:hypothetical protein M427DRAFT_106906 [Gonapodya prolifera JEL478]|eukprot:KXS22542.1 hypothetical protein M427DRAFT_106906 [Gonapodya prolifera JEL478]
MCGILVSAVRASLSDTEKFRNAWSALGDRVSRRGPDAIGEHRVENGNTCYYFFSSVLNLRSEFIRQPIFVSDSNEHQSLFFWNGEVYAGVEMGPSESDTRILASLVRPILRHSTVSEVREGLENLFSNINGEWAFALWHAGTATLFIGRDILGRRSLLWHLPVGSTSSLLGGLFVSSVSTTPYTRNSGDTLESGAEVAKWPKGFWEEVPVGIHSLELGHDDREETLSVRVSSSLLNQLLAPVVLPGLAHSGHGDISRQTAPSSLATTPRLEHPSGATVDSFLDAINNSVRLRVECIPGNTTHSPTRLAILFSGGLDCSVLALLADSYVPDGEGIDLINVAFENPRSRGVESRRNGFEGKHSHQTSYAELQGSSSGSLVPPTFNPICPDPEFSSPWDPTYLVPDRITALASLAELRRLRPRRPWRLVAVNIPFSAALAWRPIVESLITPLSSVMDRDLGGVFWWAARGVGVVGEQKDSEASHYRTPARVFLSGLGADELLGGYSRHRTAYLNGGYVSLAESLAADAARLPSRNLGRDDRVVSDWGREVRYPFLDPGVLDWCACTPIWEKVAFGVGTEVDPVDIGGSAKGGRDDLVGDKWVLRMAARRLGFESVWKEKKRATQFGSRVAKLFLDEAKAKGSDVLFE